MSSQPSLFTMELSYLSAVKTLKPSNRSHFLYRYHKLVHRIWRNYENCLMFMKKNTKSWPNGVFMDLYPNRFPIKTFTMCWKVLFTETWYKLTPIPNCFWRDFDQPAPKVRLNGKYGIQGLNVPPEDPKTFLDMKTMHSNPESHWNWNVTLLWSHFGSTAGPTNKSLVLPY